MLNAAPKEGPRAPLFYSALVLFLTANLAGAQAVDVSTLETCAELETQALKLACFEAIIAEGKLTETNSAVEDTPVPKVDPVSATGSDVSVVDEVPNVSVPDVEVASSPATSTQPAATAVRDQVSVDPANTVDITPVESITPATDIAARTTEATAAASIGSEHLPPSDALEDENQAIAATVVDVTRDSRRHLRFHLASGQVWRQIEPRHFSYPKNQEFDVEISRGLLGAYGMRIGEKGRMIKIRRIQ